jgi:hypothetical protein
MTLIIKDIIGMVGVALKFAIDGEISGISLKIWGFGLKVCRLKELITIKAIPLIIVSGQHVKNNLGIR